MKIKKILASLLAVAVMGASMPNLSAVIPNVSITASAENDKTEETYGDFKIYKYSDHVEICGYNGRSSELKIPSEIDGLNVTSIYKEAFSDCTSLA